MKHSYLLTAKITPVHSSFYVVSKSQVIIFHMLNRTFGI